MISVCQVVELWLDVPEPTMHTVVYDFDPPGYRISVDEKRGPVVEPIYRITKLLRLPWLKLALTLPNAR